MTLKPGMIAILALCFSAGAHAGALAYSLDNPAQSAFPGTSVSYTGVLQNTGTTDLFITQAIGDLVYPGLTFDYNAFFGSIPAYLVPNEYYVGEIFSVVIDPGALPGDAFGSFGFRGGADSFATDSLGTQSFELTVAPEPGSAAFFSGGLCLLALAAAARSRVRRNA